MFTFVRAGEAIALVLTACLGFALDGTQAPKAPIALEASQDIDGIYLVEGQEEGSQYAGAAVITKVGDIYRVQFAVQGHAALGTGIRQGDALCVGWVMTGGTKNAHGATLYRIMGKELHGRWASQPGDARLHAEKLTFIRALPDGDAPEPVPDVEESQ